MPSPASSRSLILACAMSRATTIGPVSDEPRLHRVLRERGADLAHRPVEVDLHDLAVEIVVGDLGQVLARDRSRAASRNTPSRGDLAERLAVGRARHRDARPGTTRRGAAAGSTRTSWQKYLPPNCAPMPNCRVSSSTCCSSSTSRKPRPSCVALGRAARRGSAPTRASRSSARTRPTCRRSRPRGGTAGTPRCRACAASRRGTS